MDAMQEESTRARGERLCELLGFSYDSANDIYVMRDDDGGVVGIDLSVPHQSWDDLVENIAYSLYAIGKIETAMQFARTAGPSRRAVIIGKSVPK